MTVRARHAAAMTVALALAVVPACGDDEPIAADRPAEVADRVCTLLRDWNNDLSGIMNATSRSITDDDDATTANGVLLDGFDEMVAAAEAHVDEVDDLDLPPVPDRARILAGLRASAQASADVLTEARPDLEELPPIGVPEQGWALSGAFLVYERATSAMRPQAAGWDAELRRAIAEDQGCDLVIQPTSHVADRSAGRAEEGLTADDTSEDRAGSGD
jgi:hypothetical protein